MKRVFTHYLLTFSIFIVQFYTAQSQSWQTVLSVSKPIQEIAIDDSGYVFVGTGGDGIYKSTDNGTTWTAINNGITNNTLARSMQCIFRTQNGSLLAGTGVDFYRSSDGGNNWSMVTGGLPTNTVGSLTQNINGYIFAGTAGVGVYRSENDGLNWQPYNIGISNQEITSLVTNSAGYVFAATLSGSVFYSTDNGNNWLSPTTFPGSTIFTHSLAVDPDDRIFLGTTYFTYPGGVYGSTDSGSTWTNLGLFNVNHIFSVATNQDGHIFAGSNDSGVYISTDHGLSWNKLNPFTLFVTSLAVAPTNYLFVGSSGGDVVRTDLSITSTDEELQSTPTNVYLGQNYPNPYNPITSIHYYLSKRAVVKLEVYNLFGQKIATLVEEEKGPGEYAIEFNGSFFSSGVYFYRMQAGSFVETKKMLMIK